MSRLTIRFRGDKDGSQDLLFDSSHGPLTWKIDGSFIRISYGNTIKAIPSDIILDVTEEL